MRPGPLGTIAKVVKERKEKPQKRLEKCAFFWAIRKSGLKTRLFEHFDSPLNAVLCSEFRRKKEQGNERFSNRHELEHRVSVTGWDSSP